MLKFMRNQAFIKTLMWIVIISFVGWLGFELGYGGGRRGGTNPEVGQIAGVPIYWTDFRQDISDLRDYQRRQTNVPMDDFDLDEQVWQQNVRRIILKQAIAQMNIVVTPDEVAQEMVSNPPSGFEKVPEFQRADGRGFDRDKYRQFLATITDQRWFQITGVSFKYYESQVRFEVQVRKLQEAIEDGGWITEAALRQAYVDQNEKVKLRVIAAPISLVPDTMVKVSEEEVRQDYQTSLREYKQPARAKLTYVLIPKRASAADSLRAINEIRDIRHQLSEGADFDELARRFSEDEETGHEGGKLGTFGRGTMVAEFDSVAFSLKPGEISDPVHTRFGWHVIKVERRVEDTAWHERWDRLKARMKMVPPEAGTPKDSVEARHILIRDNAPGVETLDSLQTMAESLTASGPRFAERAAELHLTPETTPWFTRDVLYPIQSVRDPLRRLVRWAFVGEIGTVASPASTEEYLVVARLADRRKEGPQPLEEVRDGIEAKLRLRKRVDIAAGWLAPVAAKVAQGQTMDQAVLGTDFEVIDLGPFSRSQYLPEVEAGAWDGFTGAAFALTRPGQTSGVVKVDERGAYLMTLVERTLDWTAFEGQRESLRQRLVRQRRQSLFADWELYAREAAKIEDYRDQFYTYN